MQGQSRVMDDLAKILTDAAGAAQGIRQEVEVLVRYQAERIVADLDLITRSEFEALRSMTIQLVSENEELGRRIARLEGAAANTRIEEESST